ncbi:hypothetical protein IFM89_020911, partial [Coptis chinensis]
LNLLSAMWHENLVPLIGYCSESDQQILVYPFMSNGSLQDRLYGCTGCRCSSNYGCWGMEGEIPVQLLCFVDILSPNETEREHLTRMPTRSFSEISQAVLKCHEMGVKQVLVKLAAAASLCVQVKGAIPSMPERKTVLDALQSL